MKNVLAITTAAAALMFAAPSFAQTVGSGTNDPVGEFRDVYVTDEGGTMMLRGGDFGDDGVTILGDTTYAVPADCPEGSFYWSAENVLTACGEGGASFEVVAPAADDTMSTGERYPEGVRALRPREEMRQEGEAEEEPTDTEGAAN